MCQTCGKSYKVRKSNFTPSKSPLYAGTDGYMNTCKNCIDKLFIRFTDFYSGSEEKAIERICQMFDLYFNESALSASVKISADRSRISTYISKINLNPHTGKTYSDTIIERSQNSINSVEDIKDAKDKGVTKKAVKFWGLGYSPEDYETLQGYYEDLVAQSEGETDIGQKKLLKSLALLEYQMQKNIQNNKDIGTLSNSYRSLFETAKLKKTTNDLSNDSYGCWIEDIEKYTPADYFKDKKIYDDFDKLREYAERFIFRPLKNLFMGTKDMDNEFHIAPEDEN